MSGETEKSDGQSRVGTTIAGKYHLDRLLGKGGMGVVYQATHTGIDRKFALKLMHERGDQAPDSEARFEREARAAGRIGHPNIVDVFDFGRTDDGAPYIVMELCAGESLAERLVRGPLPQQEASEIAVEMLRALEAAHGVGIVHRDIKPANVFLLEDANGKRIVKVLDFGIAKFVEGELTLTNTGAVIGSPLYMAPEQVLAEKDVDAQVDIWAVGATLYEMIAGVPPHKAPTHAAVIARIVTIPASSMRTHREDVDAQLDAIVLRALTIDKAARFATAAAMRVAIDNYLSGAANTVASLPPLGVSQSTASRPKPSRSKRPLAIAAIALFSAVFALLVFSSHPTSTQGSTTEISHATPVADPTASASGATSAMPLANEPAPSASMMPSALPSATSSAAHVDASAHVAVTTHAASHPSAAANPKCAPGEEPSLGHCCRAGLVWQGDRCDRPLATTAPF